MPSSVILAMQYQPAQRELYIAFRERREIYRYFDVGIEEWQEFLEADSKGTYLNHVFKGREHPYEKVDVLPPPSRRKDSSDPMEWGERGTLRKKAARRVEVEWGMGKAMA